jgi:hypothetical protein
MAQWQEPGFAFRLNLQSKLTLRQQALGDCLYPLGETREFPRCGILVQNTFATNAADAGAVDFGAATIAANAFF